MFKLNPILTVSLAFLLTLNFLAQPVDAQNSDDEILAAGDPPLTSLMAGKVIVLLDWVLELNLSNEEQVEIKQHLIRAWRSGRQEDISGALDAIKTYEKVFQMSESERNAARGKLRDLILPALRSDSTDPLAAMLVRKYDEKHGTSRAVSSPAISSARSGMRIGADAFTGVYRMIRPRPININNSGYEPGYWIEYITFLPNGKVYWTLPPEGLLYFDPAVAQRAHPDDWGTYEVVNDEIRILRGPQRIPYVITRTGDRLNNPPSLGKGTFRPIPPADGLKLEGSYRRAPTEPAISFTADGRFQDGGIFRYFGTGQRPDGTLFQDDGKGGSGTYTIEQYTLELKYSDGRIKHAPFIVFPENLATKPAVDSFILRREEVMKRQ